MGKIKIEEIDKIEELTEDELKSISGGKTAMPSGILQGYRLLKIKDQSFQWFTQPMTKP